MGRSKGCGVGLPWGKPFPLEERRDTFWSTVDKRPDGCWIWTGQQNVQRRKDGSVKMIYGLFCFNTKLIQAHRFSWFLAHGKMPDKPYVCHKCDVPLCVNPDHLFEGTALDNNRDAIDKGRVRHYGRPKITPDEVVEIRRLYGTGEFTYASLGVHLNLPTTQIFSALNKWKTLPLYVETQG